MTRIQIPASLQAAIRPIDLRTRESRAAQRYMEHKGYPEIRPIGAVKVEDMACWYYYYLLPECLIELEVFAQGYDFVCTRTTTLYPSFPQLAAS